MKSMEVNLDGYRKKNNTFQVTLTLTYAQVTNHKELSNAILEETKSWVESGSFDKELMVSNGVASLLHYKVKVEQK